MPLQLDDTIAALASAPGSAARGILRVSGPDVATILGRIVDPPPISSRLPQRYRAAVSLGERARLPVDVLYWPTNRSYTGQSLAELHTVGSPPLLEEVLSILYQSGARPARPGEFTLRAFLAGRLDLMQAEAVLGVIDAEDHQELETALKQLGGGLSGKIAGVHSDLLDLLSELEAGLDFVEEDIEFVERKDTIARLSRAAETIVGLLNQAETRIQSTARWRVVLAGLPNAGKSCLFNALLGEEAAIVSQVKGTTRDVLRAPLEFASVAIELIDTAGWELAPTDIMQQADAQRAEQSTQADLILFCLASASAAEEKELNVELQAEFEQRGIPQVLVLTKSDLPEAITTMREHPGGIPVSAVSGKGLLELKIAIAQSLTRTSGRSRQLIGSTAARCRESLTGAAGSLNEALSAATESLGDEIVAVELRQVLDHLGRILGTVFTDDILDRIFSKFCIGK